MPSTQEYLEFILEQLSELEDIKYRAMMGEYIIYYKEKIVGGIYDNRFLIKPTKSITLFIPKAIYEFPYKGAKEMLLIEDIENKEFLKKLFNILYDELPMPKRKNN